MSSDDEEGGEKEPGEVRIHVIVNSNLWLLVYACFKYCILSLSLSEN